MWLFPSPKGRRKGSGSGSVSCLSKRQYMHHTQKREGYMYRALEIKQKKKSWCRRTEIHHTYGTPWNETASQEN